MPNQSPEKSPKPLEEGEVQFNTGCLFILVILMVAITALFAFAAFDASLMDSLAQSDTRRNIAAAIRPFQFAGINIGALALVAYLVFETYRYIRRLTDSRAIWLDGDIIRFHANLKLKPIALENLASIKQDANGLKSELVLRTRDGRFARVKMVDEIDAEAFVALIKQERAGQPAD